MPDLQFYLNDLPGNDFNTLFQGLINFSERYKDVPCFVMGAPGSFHGHLFPCNSLHLVHSSYGVHWLSKTRTGYLQIKGRFTPAVIEAYLAQFQEHFDLFLKLRSQEMIHDGRVILILHGRQSADPTSKENCYPWEPLSEAIANMVSLEVKDVVYREGSFGIELLETFAIQVGDKGVWNTGEKLANNIRSFRESMISHHFRQEILDKLYDNFAQIAIQDLATQTEPTKLTSIIIAPRRFSVI